MLATHSLFYLFCGLFSDTSSSSDCVVLNDELERMWKEAVMTYMKVLSWHMSRETELRSG
jgi:hypothetical protein